MHTQVKRHHKIALVPICYRPRWYNDISFYPLFPARVFLRGKRRSNISIITTIRKNIRFYIYKILCFSKLLPDYQMTAISQAFDSLAVTSPLIRTFSDQLFYQLQIGANNDGSDPWVVAYLFIQRCYSITWWKLGRIASGTIYHYPKCCSIASSQV